MDNSLEWHRSNAVALALFEDIGSGDITADLIAADNRCRAQILVREDAVICGTEWVDEVFRQLDDEVAIQWHLADGEQAFSGQFIASLEGNTRAILTAERSALNFLQTLSGTATVARRFADALGGSTMRIRDTRKTLPGFRAAQKYAIRCSGCDNHRMGLFDAFLIKENHIAACGGIAASIQAARERDANCPLEIEVESLQQLRQALEAGADMIMLDNFQIDEISPAVALRQQVRPTALLEVSGNLDIDRVSQLRESGVDYVSIGALTKHCRAVDLSLKIVPADTSGLY